MADEIKTNVAMPHKGKIIFLKKGLNYKLEVIGYAESNSNSSASQKSNVDKKRNREWRKSKDKFLSLRKKIMVLKEKYYAVLDVYLLISKWKKYLSNGSTTGKKKDCQFLENL